MAGRYPQVGPQQQQQHQRDAAAPGNQAPNTATHTRHFVRANKAFDPVIKMLRASLAARMPTFYNDLLDGNYGGVKLGELDVCQHQDPNGEFATKSKPVKRSKLEKCPTCSQWLAAMGEAQVEGKVSELASSMYPGRWRDPTLGPFAIIKSFTQAGKAHILAKADATCIINIVLRCKGAFPDLSTQDRTNLEQLLAGRNHLSHLHEKALTAEDKAKSIAVCRAVLASGPWTKDAVLIKRACREVDKWAADPWYFSLPITLLLITITACLVILGFTLWRMRTNKLLPPLPQLEPHYIPQHQLLHNVTQTLLLGDHRIAALSGMGGVGKSTTALALSWQLARSGACPGRHGVLWGAAGSHSGGIAGALADVVQRQLGLELSESEASDDAVVREKLRGWAARRHDPWLLVLDNVEPGTQEDTLLSLLGEHGLALITTRAGRNALYRDIGLPRTAVLRVECLAIDDGFALMVARYKAAPNAPEGPLSASEEAAVRELAGTGGLNGLPLAMEQVAALVGSTPGTTFVDYLAEFRQELLKRGRLPGDDGGHGSFARAITATVEASGLADDVPGLVDQVLTMCESLDDVQWMEASDVMWGDGVNATSVQVRKWAAFKQRCAEQSASVRQQHTVATVWATQLKVLPKFCVELLRLASSFAPDHIPQVVFEKALVKWMEVGDGSGKWMVKVADGSELVAQARRKQGGTGSAVAGVAESVVEEALQWLEDYSLVRRGHWQSAGDIHPKLATGALGAALGGGTTPSQQVKVGADGVALCAAESSGCGGGAQHILRWFSVHRLVQGVVRGSGGAAAGGHHVVAALHDELRLATTLVQNVCSGDLATTLVQQQHIGDMRLAAWLAARHHAVHVAQATVASSDKVAAGIVVDGMQQFSGVLERLSRLVKALGLYREGGGWIDAVSGLRRWLERAGHAAKAASFTELASLYQDQSRYAEAEPLLVQALAMEQRLHGGSDSSVVATSLNNLALLYDAQSRYDEAEPLYVQALAMYQRLHGGSDSSAVAGALNNLALLYESQSRYAEAEPLLVQVLAMQQRLHGDSDSSDVATALNNLALLYEDQSRYDEAEPLYVQALAMWQRLAGNSDSSAVASALRNLAGLYKAQSRYDEAEPLFVQALAMEQRLHGDSDSSDVAGALTHLASLYRAQSRYDEAEPLFVQALAMEQRLHGDSDSSDVAGALSNLGLLYEAQSRYDEAEPLLVQALALFQRLHVGSDSSAVARSLTALGALYRAQSRYAEAEPLCVQALAMFQRLHGGSDSTDVASAVNNLAGLLWSQRRYDEAEPLLVQALAMRQRLHGDSDSSYVAEALNNLAALYRAQSRYDEAEPLYVRALAMLQRMHGNSDSSGVAAALHNLARLYKTQSRYAEAEPLLVQALAMKQRLHGGSDSSEVAQSLHNLAVLYKAQSRYAEAEPLFVQALAMRQRLHGDSDSFDVAQSLDNLAGLHYEQSRYSGAEALFAQALAMYQRLHGSSDSSDVARALNNLATLYYEQGRYDEAEPLMVQALAMHQRLHGDSDSSAVAGALDELATLYYAWSRYDKAEPLFVQALALYRRIHGSSDSSDVANAMHNVGTVATYLKKYSKARRLLIKAAKLRRRLGNKQGTAQSMMQLAFVYSQQGDTAKEWRLWKRLQPMTQYIDIDSKWLDERMKTLSSELEDSSS